MLNEVDNGYILFTSEEGGEGESESRYCLSKYRIRNYEYKNQPTKHISLFTILPRQ